jgi:hypothetical protein
MKGAGSNATDTDAVTKAKQPVPAAKDRTNHRFGRRERPARRGRPVAIHGQKTGQYACRRRNSENVGLKGEENDEVQPQAKRFLPI